MNWGFGKHDPVLDYFDDPTAARLTLLESQLRTAHQLGANSMRIPIELDQVMRSPTQARADILTALKQLLAVAASQHVYLDITGNVNWRPWHVAAWYERLSVTDRWQAQANFWRAVAHAGASSPAVLCYELTSEPLVTDNQSSYYEGDWGGETFEQNIGTIKGRSDRWVARAWTEKLAAAVRSQDNRPVTIGLLPRLDGGFAPQNVADLLDMLSVHVYPITTAAAATAIVKANAAYQKPVLLGETFPLHADEATERTFLLDSLPDLVGVFEFFDGRDANDMTVTTISDAVYQAGLRQFINLRSAILEPR
jgi:hypothetical protein